MERGREVGRNLPVWVGFLILLALDVPWYLPSSAQAPVLGIPAWVLVCLGVNAALACYTAWVIRRCWGEEDG